MDSDKKIYLDERAVTKGNSYFRYRRKIERTQNSDAKITRFLRGIRQQDDFRLDCIPNELTSHLTEDYEPKVDRGVLFSNEMVIDSANYIELLKLRNKIEFLDVYSQKARLNGEERRERGAEWYDSELDAVDMESFGFFSSLNALGIGNAKNATGAIAAIRGISDLASKKAELDDVSGNKIRKIAGRNAAKVAVEFIRQVHNLTFQNQV